MIEEIMPAVSVTLFHQLPHSSRAGEVAVLQGAAELRMWRNMAGGNAIPQ
jgi:hypothetical protein